MDKLMRRLVVIFLAGVGSCVQELSPSLIPNPELRAAIGGIKEGTSVKEVDRLLAPFLLAKATSYLGGSGAEEIRYHLRGNLEFSLTTGHHPKHGEVACAGDLRPKGKWYGLFWQPSESEWDRALEVALEKIRRESEEGRDLTAQHPIDPAGRAVSGKIRRVQMASSAYNVSLGSCQYWNHRLISLDFLKGDSWVFQLTVDVDDGEVVSTQWQPSADEIAKARSIADPTIRGFLTGPGKLEVKAWGKYDFGPLRRLVVICYQRHAEVTHLEYATVALDQGRMFEW